MALRSMLLGAVRKAVERGVFWAPAFFVGDEMFWGNDRLHFVEAALQKGGWSWRFFAWSGLPGPGVLSAHGLAAGSGLFLVAPFPGDISLVGLGG